MQDTAPSMMQDSAPSTSARAAAGAAGAAVALALSELLTGLLGAGSSLVEGIGEWVIDVSPSALTKFAIEVFGQYDKPVLVVSIVLVGLVAGAVLGVLSKHGSWIPIVGFALFGVFAAYTGASHPDISAGVAVLVAAASAVVGLLVMWRLLSLAVQSPDGEEGEAASPERRALLVGLGAVGALAVASAGVGRALLGRAKIVAAGRNEVVLPTPRLAVADAGAEASFALEGLSPIVTPNDEFYIIDTALTVPRVDLETWSLTLSGLVDRPIELRYEDLLDMPMVERYVTLCCVSNEVGGDLIGNAKWLGVPLEDLLTRAGVQQGADQIVGRSVDDFTVGFPTEVALDGREALVAVGMNGEPLPFDHGFPARIVISGLYGYVSATKWLSDIELTTWDAFDAYWIPRGWAKEGPVKTQSRIDLPRNGASLEAGPQRIAGVAWAQNKGITRVEVRAGDGPWLEAQVSEPLSKDTWVQWLLDWDAPAGNHLISVRATDATGMTQGSTYYPPRPDGAEGYHTIRVTVA